MEKYRQHPFQPWIVRALTFVLFSALAFTSANAQQGSASKAAADGEKRSSIHEVDGYANLSEDMTLKQTRTMAFANAKRQAVEMAQAYIKTKTTVEDFVLTSDAISATAEGAVRVLEQKDIGIENNTRYHVWIRAEVTYKLMSDSEPERVMAPDAPLTVKVWTSKKTYTAGEQIEIYIRGNRDFYARIVDVMADGNIVQLLPNDYRTINHFEGGKIYKIPDAGDQFDLKVSPPFGQDQIVVYASEEPLGEVDMQPIGGGLNLVTGDRDTLAAKTRGISVVKSGPKAAAGTEFYESTWTMSTIP